MNFGDLRVEGLSAFGIYVLKGDDVPYLHINQQIRDRYVEDHSIRSVYILNISQLIYENIIGVGKGGGGEGGERREGGVQF